MPLPNGVHPSGAIASICPSAGWLGRREAGHAAGMACHARWQSPGTGKVEVASGTGGNRGIPGQRGNHLGHESVATLLRIISEANFVDGFDDEDERKASCRTRRTRGALD